MREHYQTLGLDPDRPYSAEEIKAAWRKKCLTAHPDKGGSEEEFQKVTHAYNYLTNPSYRYEQDNDSVINLHIRLNVPISFSEGFFGAKITLNFNQGTVSKEGDIVREDPIEIVTEVIQIPPGTGRPLEILLAKKGFKQSDSDKVGNAFVTIVPNISPRYKIVGMDVMAAEQVALDILLKGGVINVETLYGIQELKVPPGTAPGSRLLIPNCGVSKRGNHVAHLEARYPTKEELKKSKAWKGLNIKWEDDNV